MTTRDRPPFALWLAPLLVAGLRALPWAAAVGGIKTAAGVPLPIGYNPKDWLQYVAFIREAAAGDFLLANPFTTAAQDGRYLPVFFDLLGVVCRFTGVDPFTVLELSRVPLLFLLLAAVWQIGGVALVDRRHRVLASWLVMLAGGLEVVAERVVPYLPEQVGWQMQQDLWHLQGWNTFAASYNPLWVAALALTLVALLPLVRPGGPRGIRDALRLGGGFFLLVLIHPYSAIVVLAVAAGRPLLGWLLALPNARAGAGVTLAGLLPALALSLALWAWQSGDAVYRATAGRTLGVQALSVFWYPVTLGVVGLLAIRGWRWWITGDEAGRLGLGAWTLAVVVLHSSTVLNGYHFVFHLWPPLCLAAAPALASTLDRLRARPWGLAGVAALLVLLFQTPLTLTAKCVGEVATHRIRPSGLDALGVLAALPAGNVLAPTDLGNYVPAYTNHRVYVGHWFLTPRHAERVKEVDAIFGGRATEDQIVGLVERERIRYVVAAAAVAPRLAAALGPRVGRTLPAGELAVLVLGMQ